MFYYSLTSRVNHNYVAKETNLHANAECYLIKLTFCLVWFELVAALSEEILTTDRWRIV